VQQLEEEDDKVTHRTHTLIPSY